MKVNQQKGGAEAGNEAAKAEAQARQQPNAGVLRRGRSTLAQVRLPEGQTHAEGKEKDAGEPTDGRAARLTRLLPHIRQGAGHEAHEQEEEKDFMAGIERGQPMNADEDTNAGGQKKWPEAQQVEFEVFERVGQRGGQGTVEAEQDEECAAGKSRQKAGQADNQSPQQMTQQRHETS